MTGPSSIRRALVTGASSGIGAEFARRLASRGAHLVLVARREQRLQALADELGRPDLTVEVEPADLADPSGVRRVEDRLASMEAPVDLLVNNAGFGAYGPFTDIDRDRQAAMIDVNVTALTRLSHAAMQAMAARGGGAIINVASTEAFQPGPFGAVYAATKAFVLSLSHALHEEGGPERVRVLAVCPGLTTTEFQDEAGVSEDLPGALVMDPGPVVETALRDLARDRAVSIPGWNNKVTAGMSSVSPTALTRRVSARLHRRFTGGGDG